jgi:hypothetical protein
MDGVMGVVGYNFGGKTWSSFYYAQQVNYNGVIPNGGILQSYI